MNLRQVVIDTDPGVDDAMAVFMALASPELDVVGLTTIFGNAATSTTTPNALTLLEVAGRTDIPVAAGSDAPIATDYLGPVPFVHGTNGLGDAEISPPTTPLDDRSAAEFIAGTAAAHPGEVTLLALGPLTNLALVVRDHPEVVGLVRDVVVMGGNALGPGNATPSAEANINNDPEAADAVFGAGWPVTMIGLDVTHQVVLDGAALDRLAVAPTRWADLLGRAVPHYRRFFESNNGTDGIYVHDPTTVAYLVDPTLFETRSWSIRVETESFSRGKTWPNLADTDERTPPAWRGRPPVDVAVEVDAAAVADLVEARLSISPSGAPTTYC